MAAININAAAAAAVANPFARNFHVKRKISREPFSSIIFNLDMPAHTLSITIAHNNTPPLPPPPPSISHHSSSSSSLGNDLFCEKISVRSAAFIYIIKRLFRLDFILMKSFFFFHHAPPPSRCSSPL
jgi:hypothetical protein